MSSNFDFLAPVWPRVHENAVRAESYLHTDPRSACFYARRTMELVVEGIYRLRGLPEPYKADLAARINADNELSRAMTQLNVTMESYPQLRSSENFVQLQRSLNEVEEQISAARRSYNAAAVEYNNAIEMFPGSIVANAMGFQTKQLYAAEARKLQDVDMRALFKS